MFVCFERHTREKQCLTKEFYTEHMSKFSKSITKDTKLNFKMGKRFEQTFLPKANKQLEVYRHGGELLFCSYGSGMEPTASHIPGQPSVPELRLSSSSLSEGGKH